MIRKNAIVGASALVLTFAWSGAFAQDDDEGGMRVGPVETYTCKYNDGKGPEDLEKAIASFNRFMDDKDVNTYGAMTLTPHYHGPDAFDVGWLGYWTDGNAMGQGQDMWLAEGGETAAAMFDVLTCDTHSGFAVTGVKEPPSETQPDTSVMYFSDCNVSDDSDFETMMAGLKKWADYMTEQEYNNGVWLMFPAFGDAGMDMDFKMVTSYESHAAAGSAWEKYGNGGGWMKRNEIMGDTLSCDTSRVYNATARRRIEMGGE
jgi:hypothetical protein